MDAGFSTSHPIYRQIMDRLCHSIVRGELAAGERLLSVREAAVAFGVNPNTIQRVYAELDRLEVTATRRGLGTFVTESRERISKLRRELESEAIQDLVRALEDLGLSETEILEALSLYLSRRTGAGERGAGRDDG